MIAAVGVLAACCALLVTAGEPDSDRPADRVPDTADSVRLDLAPRVSDRFPVTRPVARTVQQTPRDRWFALDKLQHFTMSYGFTVLGYGAVRGAGGARSESIAAGVALSVAAGLGKEFADRARGGPFSTKDLVWDGVGTAAGVLLLTLAR